MSTVDCLLHFTSHPHHHRGNEREIVAKMKLFMLCQYSKQQITTVTINRCDCCNASNYMGHPSAVRIC